MKNYFLVLQARIKRATTKFMKWWNCKLWEDHDPDVSDHIKLVAGGHPPYNRALCKRCGQKVSF